MALVSAGVAIVGNELDGEIDLGVLDALNQESPSGRRRRARARSATLRGVEAVPVSVEVDISSMLPVFHLVGLPNSAVREARERVRAAVAASGERFPLKRIVVNLAPADLPKRGTHFDLPIAVGVLAAEGRVPPAALSRWLLFGELSLGGALRPVRGALAAALAARDSGVRGIILPRGNAREAAAVPGIEIVGAGGLAEVLGILRGERRPEPPPPQDPRPIQRHPALDLADVRGLGRARRALEIAAAGGHNLLLVGPPGCGKTMLARRLPGLLPPMSEEEALAATRIWSVAGLLPATAGLLRERPLRAPHHTISARALAGGGRPIRPGEVSLAHTGVLLLDELPEFSRSSLEVLRQPLSDGEVHIARASERLVFPARFQLIGTMNPCPCGQLGSPRCHCTRNEVRRYQGRVSGPLLDRIDLAVGVVPPSAAALSAGPGETSAVVRARVTAAWRRQAARGCRNAHLPGSRATAGLEQEAVRLIERAVDAGLLSARSRVRVCRVARTLADLADRPVPGVHEVAEAIGLRSLDRDQAL